MPLDPQLRRGQRNAPARGTKTLPRFCRAVDAIVEPELGQHAAGDRRAASGTRSGGRIARKSALVLRAVGLIQLDAQLRGTLEDVEELAEWQIQQRADHGDSVEDRQEAVERAATATSPTPSAPGR